MTTYTVYHGTNEVFDAPDLAKSRNFRDFGKGFYTTTIVDQALEWGMNMLHRFGGSDAYLYEFIFDLTDELTVKTFQELSIDWLEMIKLNRIKGGIQHDYDVVIGPVANDNTFRAITLYLEGDYTAEQVIEKLRWHKPNDQISVHTPKALSKLTLVRRDCIGE